MKIPDSLKAYYPEAAFMLHVEQDEAEIANLLDSKGVTTWGQGDIGTTDYFYLASPSPKHAGDRRLVIVAPLEKVRWVQRARRIVAYMESVCNFPQAKGEIASGATVILEDVEKAIRKKIITLNYVKRNVGHYVLTGRKISTKRTWTQGSNTPTYS